jgi:glycerol uptake facilitator-like aquaporin
MVKRIIKFLQSCIGELFASFIFGFAVYTSIIGSAQTSQLAAPVIIGLTIGLSGVAIIYSFCDITVAHFNPAITFAALCTRRISVTAGISYILFQLIGFILAGLATVAVLPGKYKNKLDIARPKKQNADLSLGSLFAAEFIMSAILVYVVFAVGANPYIPPKDENNEQLDPDEEITEGRKNSGPIAIGFTLGFLAFLGIGNSGGAFNPGIVLSPMILSGIWTHWWVYLLAQFSGGLVGGCIQAFVLYKLF